MIKFSDLVSTKVSGCAKCFSVLYALPCQIDRDIAQHFKEAFGKPVYPLKSVSFMRIDAHDGFHIEGRLRAKVIKFVMPKKFEKQDLDKIDRKIEFERCLTKWLESKLNIKVTE